MDLGLEDKRALVLASSRGIGLGIAQGLAAEGAHVVLVGRNRERLGEAAAGINAKGRGTAQAMVADLAKPEDIAALVAGVERELGGVDILLNNTGGPPAKPAVAVTPDDLRRQFDVMVTSLVAITNHVLPAMRTRKWGRILTVASSGVLQPLPHLALSNTLRAALMGWGKTLAAEVAADGVTVNMILPGRIHTERVNEIDRHTAKTTGKTVEEVVAASKTVIPAGRYGTVAEIAAMAVFLLSGPASYVTGSIVRVDGGLIRSH